MYNRFGLCTSRFLHKDCPRAERIKIFAMVIDQGIQMKRKKLTKAFMMISNWKKNLWFPWFAKICRRSKG